MTSRDPNVAVQLSKAITKYAQDTADSIVDAKEEAVTEERTQVADRQFAGINFGVAIGVLVPLRLGSRVSEAVLVPGDPAVPDSPKIVRAKTRKSSDARVLLETHYFFPFQICGQRLGAGPVLVVQPGTAEIVEGVGLGFMMGARRAKDTSDSFNLGLAIFMERSVTELGSGIEENKPLPAGETEIRYQQTPKASLMALASFSF